MADQVAAGVEPQEKLEIIEIEDDWPADLPTKHSRGVVSGVYERCRIIL